VVINEKINETERTRVHSQPRATYFFKNLCTGGSDISLDDRGNQPVWGRTNAYAIIPEEKHEQTLLQSPFDNHEGFEPSNF
jgi:hypothetical protein